MDVKKKSYIGLCFFPSYTHETDFKILENIVSEWGQRMTNGCLINAYAYSKEFSSTFEYIIRSVIHDIMSRWFTYLNKKALAIP